ncbi:hypothetical protein, partial [Acetobacter senegalensis]|uniref:hypothetical protein n=1 Tax=Acetobacter senegalensis TaxID=446692 RepID=UPI001B8021B6
NLKAAGSNPAPATTSIINHYKSTSDRHEILAHQTVTRVSALERRPSDHARLRYAMAYRAASIGFSDRFQYSSKEPDQCMKIRKCVRQSVPE